MPDPLTAEFIDDQTAIDRPRATSTTQRRRALTWCLNNLWDGVDIDTLERVDNDHVELYGWAMWPRV